MSSLTQAVKHSDFKSCTQSGFCRRNRALAESIIKSGPVATWKAEEVEISKDGQVSFVLERLSTRLQGHLSVLADDVIRLRLDPVNGNSSSSSSAAKRYRIPEADVIKATGSGRLEAEAESEGIFKIANSQLKVKLSASPFSLSLISGVECTLLQLNSENLLHLETGQSFALDQLAAGLSDELWTEPYFRGRLDSRPKGPNSLAMDIAFPSSEALYGIPEHASSLALQGTRSIHQQSIATKSDPYRLFNLDVFEYELDSTMALYGVIPIMLGHTTAPGKLDHRSVGVFWNNPSETWVDVYEVAHSQQQQQQQKKLTHWMSESGSFEVFLMASGDLKGLQGKIKQLTGPPQLPPAFALGYHQCRWNYQNVADVLEVQEKFDEHEMPVDVIWLDIEHTDGKRYMTWHPRDFADPLTMQEELASKGRKLVTIVDPHLKKDPEWPVYQELIAGDLAVKGADGVSTFEGKCWPGWSVWTDYSNPAARKWWSSLFGFEKYTVSLQRRRR
jgi:alpha 1,3-glucosidase